LRLTSPAAASSSPITTANGAPEASARFICDLKLPPPQCSVTAKPVRKPSATRKGGPLGGLAGVHQVHIGHHALGLAAGLLPQGEQTLDAHREARRRRRLAAELGDEAVVTAAGADRALGARRVVNSTVRL
jgi:hypothetical protein